MVHTAVKAAAALAKSGIEVEIIDPRTTSPLDKDAILTSVKKTGKLVVVDEASPRCNMATDISALVAQEAFDVLTAPIVMVSPPHTPAPFAANLEKLYLPDAAKIEAAVLSVVNHKKA
jgi:pyruvate dehydrogenase E1 component beta subunit